MFLNYFGRGVIVAAMLALLCVPAVGRTPVGTLESTPLVSSSVYPAYCLAQHDAGQLALTVSNYGHIGLHPIKGQPVDCFTGAELVSCEYPKGSGNDYLYSAAVWIGAVVGTDTLVSVGFDGWIPAQEMFPDEAPAGSMIHRSTLDPGSPEFAGAISEQDFIAVYTDTFTSGVSGLALDEIDGRPHIPLGLEITQTSMAWSVPFAEDFVLLDYTLKNVGDNHLSDVYFGILVDGDVTDEGGINPSGYFDDLTGFISDVTGEIMGCGVQDTVNLAWIADNDGELGSSTYPPIPDVTGMRFLQLAPSNGRISYNWWVCNQNDQLDYGPQTKSNLRDLSTGGQGTPAGDRNKYFFMRNGERDFDQAYTSSISSDDDVWVYPTQAIAPDLSDGWDTRYLISIGPFDIAPGQTLSIPMAYVGGQGLHTVASNLQDNLSPGSYNPDAYYANLDFSDFTTNARHAAWVYDNPGVDTDSDGYAGEFIVCGEDTVYTTGDGVPDYRIGSDPQAPETRVESGQESLVVHWNGATSELSPDGLSQLRDFEGYRVYLSNAGDAADPALIASYDVEDYQTYVWDAVNSSWRMRGEPLLLEAVRCLYADSCGDLEFQPDLYSREDPFIPEGHPDSIIAFEPVGDNASEFPVETQIHKSYPDQPYPTSVDPGEAEPWELTPEGRLKYFEYELVIDNLLPDHCYSVVVTSFDYGWPVEGIASSECSMADISRRGCTGHAANCCLDGYTGNTNCDEHGIRNLRDVLRLIDYLYISHNPLCCEEEGNVDGDVEREINLTDVLRLIDAIYITRLPTAPCP